MKKEVTPSMQVSLSNRSYFVVNIPLSFMHNIAVDIQHSIECPFSLSSIRLSLNYPADCCNKQDIVRTPYYHANCHILRIFVLIFCLIDSSNPLLYFY